MTAGDISERMQDAVFITRSCMCSVFVLQNSPKNIFLAPHPNFQEVTTYRRISLVTRNGFKTLSWRRSGAVRALGRSRNNLHGRLTVKKPIQHASPTVVAGESSCCGTKSVGQYTLGRVERSPTSSLLITDKFPITLCTASSFTVVDFCIVR